MKLSNPLSSGVTRLAPRDAEFIYNEWDGKLQHLMGIWFFETTGRPEAEFTQEQAVEWITRRMGYARFFTHRVQRVKLGIDHPYWVRAEDLDVREHVTATTVTEPGWAGLQTHLNALLTARVDLSRPPWEMHFFHGIEGFDDIPGRLTAVAIKTHHSVGDGMARRELGEALFSDIERPADHPLAIRERTVPLVRGRMLATSILGFPLQLGRFAKGLSRTKDANRRMQAAIAAGELGQEVIVRDGTRFNGQASGSAVMRPITIPGMEVKQIRAAVPGATVNDVLLAVIGGALSNYLAELGEPHEGSLVAMVPRSMRKVEQWESANQVVSLSVDMGTDTEDLLERLAAIVASSQKEKDRTNSRDVRLVGTRLDTAPPLILRLVAASRRHVGFRSAGGRYQHTMVSNIPLSVEGLSLNGAPGMAVLASQPPVDGDGVLHFMVAAAGGGLTINVIADSAQMPDLPRYLELIRESFAALKKAAGV